MGNNLLEWAARNKMSYARIGRDLNVHDSLISKIVNGHRRPSAELRLRFLRKYGTINYLQVFGQPEGPEVKISKILAEEP